MQKIVFILFLVFLINGTTACSVSSLTYQKIKDKALSLVGLGETKPSKKTTGKKKEPSPNKEEVEPNFPEVPQEVGDSEPSPTDDPALSIPKVPVPDKIEANSENLEVPINPSNDEPTPPVPDGVPTPNPANPALSPSFMPIARLGGTPDGIFAQKDFVYVTYGASLKVFDKDLNYKAQAILDAPALQVVSFSGKIPLIFVFEQNNTFEVFSFAAGTTLESVKSFEVAGPAKIQMAGTNPRLVVFFPDRIQVLDLSDPATNIPVVLEWPEKVDDAYLAGDLLYLAVGPDLKIVRLSDLSVVSKYTVGTSFKIAGTSLSRLVVLPQDPSQLAVQLFALNPDGTLNKAGGLLHMASPIKKVTSLTDTGLYYVDDVLKGHVYNFETNSMEDEGLPLGLLAVDQTVLYAASPGELAVYKTEMPVTNISQGLVKPKGKSYVKGKTLVSPSSIDAVVLGAAPKLSLISSQFYLADRGLDGTPLYAPLSTTVYKPSLLHLTSHGYVFFDEASGKLATLKIDLSGLQTFEMASQNIKGFDTIKTATLDRVVYAVASKDGKGEESLNIAQMVGGKSLKVETKTKITQAGGLRFYAGGTKVLMAGGADGIVSYDIAEKPKAITKTKVIVSRIPGARALDVTVDFNEKWALVYHESGNGNFISVIMLDSLTEASIIGDLTLSARQFAGLSFTDGGKTVIFPHEKGVTFYDLSNPSKPSKITTWDTGNALFVDVTNKGKTVCAALGPQGLVCGNR
ncbi:hypothetical protein K1X76_02230 [bacterium]|nr:hypothetical protein [bacterium]